MHNKEELVGVVLMTYGSATTAEHVEEYFERIYKGKASKETIQDFENRYRLVGHSPLVEISREQAALVQQELGGGYVVQSGMRHSEPFIESAVRACKDAGATSLIGVILSPQFSSFIMEGYCSALEAAAAECGFTKEHTAVAGAWPTEEYFIELLGKRVTKSLDALKKEYGTQVPVVFTTHSLPQRVVDKDPSYLTQLQATIERVVASIAEPFEWYAAYQSAGHTPEEWLKPDLVDVLAQLQAKQAPAVLIVPIQFLTDHLEILYDLDIAAKKQCEEFGIAYHRIELPNTDPFFIKALAAVVQSTRLAA